MPNPFIPHRSQTAEASLQQSFDQSVHQLTQLTRRLMAWQPEPKDNFPKPDLSELASPPDEPPDSVRAQLQTRTVAATAAVLTEAYGEGGQYQAEGYTIQSSTVEGGTTSYQIATTDSQQTVFAFERDNKGVLTVQDNQLSDEQTQDFLQVAERITAEGFEPLETDTSGQARAEVLGSLAPAGEVAQRVNRHQSKEAVPAHPEPPSSVTALDLVQWRYASIVLGRDKQQVNRITTLAQAAGKVSGQSFAQLYNQNRDAALPLQPKSEDLPQMQRDIQQLKDLVWQVGPKRVEQLYQTQQQLDTPIAISRNEQVTASQTEQTSLPIIPLRSRNASDQQER